MITAKHVLNSRSLLITMDLIQHFLYWKRVKYGYEGRCFSYRGLRNHLYYGRYTKTPDDIEWHSIARAVRKYAEEGYLERRKDRRGRTRYFCITGQWNYLVREVESLRAILDEKEVLQKLRLLYA